MTSMAPLSFVPSWRVVMITKKHFWLIKCGIICAIWAWIETEASFWKTVWKWKVITNMQNLTSSYLIFSWCSWIFHLTQMSTIFCTKISFSHYLNEMNIYRNTIVKFTFLIFSWVNLATMWYNQLLKRSRIYQIWKINFRIRFSIRLRWPFKLWEFKMLNSCPLNTS